jgi:outer membrane lipoprotein-sorting protein
MIVLIFINQKIILAEQQTPIKNQVESFFNQLKTLESDFIQVSPSGKISNGKLFLDLPGKLRIDYEKPSNFLVTCKGFWLVVQNRNVKTTNNIPIKQTPFSILLDNNINFDNEELVVDLKKISGVISLKIKLIENNKAGELTLEFSEKPFSLKKWIITDVIGEKTTVLIQNVKYNNNLPFTLFFPDIFPEPNN